MTDQELWEMADEFIIGTFSSLAFDAMDCSSLSLIGLLFF